MDTKRLLNSLLIAGAIMVIMTLFFKNNGSAPPPAGPAIFPIYSHVPDQSQASEAGAVAAPVMLGTFGPASKDKISLTLNPVTAGIDKVQLNPAEYPDKPHGGNPLTLFEALPGAAKPFATSGIHLKFTGSAAELPYGQIHGNTDGKATTRPATLTDSAEAIATSNSTNLLDTQYLWKMEPSPDPQTVVFSMTLQTDGKPAVKVTKTFQTVAGSYEVTISHTIVNLTDKPLMVSIDQLTAPDFPRDDPRSDDRFFHASGLDSTKAAILPEAFNMTHLELGKIGTTPPTPGTREIGQFNDFKKNPFLWVASSNRFFVAVIRPLPETGSTAKVAIAGHDVPEVHHIASGNLDLLQTAPKPADEVAILRFTGAALEVPANGSITEPLSVYFGPKKRDVLQGDVSAPVTSSAYAYFVYKYQQLLQFNRGCFLYSFCVLDTLVIALLWLLDFLHRTVAFGNYGIAIMILVVIVRAILHPLTRASQINMAKMGKKMKDVQPYIESMKKKYPDNKKKQSEEQIRIYREHNVNPVGGILGCLPMLLQMPIWAALYSGLAMDIDLRHASFIPGWINDLSSPDTIFPHVLGAPGHPLFTLPLINFEIYGLNPLPLLLAVVLFVNMRVTLATQPKPADPEQAKTQQMMSYVSVLFLPFILYNASSGSNLYFFASTMAGLVDTYLVRKSLKKQGILPSSAAALPTHEEES